MARTESTFSERVGARVLPELKESLRELVDAEVFDSEADAVREALWQYVERGPDPVPAVEADSSHLEWLMSALFMLVALVGSRILKALGQPPVAPAELADEAIQETIYNHHILRHKLASARHIARELEGE